jgi:hypothetical protein
MRSNGLNLKIATPLMFESRPVRTYLIARDASIAPAESAITIQNM